MVSMGEGACLTERRAAVARMHLGALVWALSALRFREITAHFEVCPSRTRPGFSPEVLDVLRRFTHTSNNGLVMTDPAWGAPVNRANV